MKLSTASLLTVAATTSFVACSYKSDTNFQDIVNFISDEACTSIKTIIDPDLPLEDLLEMLLGRSNTEGQKNDMTYYYGTLYLPLCLDDFSVDVKYNDDGSVTIVKLWEKGVINFD